jgi:hypothetical protein
MSLRQQAANICYYSNKCEWSEAFIKELAATPYKSEFQFVSVDTTPRSQLPDWLKKVPTLLIRGDDPPIKTDSEVLNWLYIRKLKDTQREPARVQQSPGQAQGQGQGLGEPEAWNISEMGGKLSESYGNLAEGPGVENSSSKNFDFGFLNGNAAPGDRTTQGIGGDSMRQEPGRAKSKKEEMFDKQMEAYQQNRNSGLPQVRPRIAGP